MLMNSTYRTYLRNYPNTYLFRGRYGDDANDESSSSSSIDSSSSSSSSSSSYPFGIPFSDSFNDGVLHEWWTFVDNDGIGGTSWTEASGTLDIDAGGADIWFPPDDEYASMYIGPVSGDWEAITKITSQEATNPWVKSGIMVRNDIELQGVAGGYAIVGITPGNDFIFQWDNNGDGYLEESVHNVGATTYPCWLKLKRVTNNIAGEYSTNGTDWNAIGNITFGGASIGSSVDVGLFVGGVTLDVLSLTQFDSFSIS